jgi:prepilin-type N-terminal cleavage/methylation domain-containing protein
MLNRRYDNINNGFTIAELLVVVAIIGVLIAVSIPVFTSQKEKAANAVDVYNAKAIGRQLRYYYLSNSDELDKLKSACSTEPYAIEFSVQPEGVFCFPQNNYTKALMESIIGAVNANKPRDNLNTDKISTSIQCKSNIKWKQYCVAVTPYSPSTGKITDDVHIIYTAWDQLDHGTYKWDNLLKDTCKFKTACSGDQ